MHESTVRTGNVCGGDPLSPAENGRELVYLRKGMGGGNGFVKQTILYFRHVKLTTTQSKKTMPFAEVREIFHRNSKSSDLTIQQITIVGEKLDRDSYDHDLLSALNGMIRNNR